MFVDFLQGGSIVMLFNVMQESYVAGRANLPDERQKADIEGERMYSTSICISHSIF